MRRVARAWILCAASLGATIATPAFALQPLSAFVESSKRENPDNRESAALQQQRDAQRDAAAPYLPSLTAQGVYTHNQYEASINFEGQDFIITPKNQLDAYFTVAVPIINVGAWEQRRVATANLDQSVAARANTELTVESSVTQAYYQLLGNEAVLFAAKKSAEYAQGNLKIVTDRRQLGTASELDLQRAASDLAHAQQDVASGDQGVVNARRALESLARLSPEPATRENYQEDALTEEKPLEAWLGQSSADLVAARPSIAATDAAQKNRAATKAVWLPTIAGQGQERLTNAAGFTGHGTYYTLTATATWKLDFSLGPNVAVQTAIVAGALAREDKARRAAADAIFQAWNQVRVGIEKARAARAQLKASTLAQDLAHDRYEAGVATQIEVIQAQRDYFQAGVSQAQADFDLQYARALLRLSSRRVSQGESPQ